MDKTNLSLSRSKVSKNVRRDVIHRGSTFDAHRSLIPVIASGPDKQCRRCRSRIRANFRVNAAHF